MNKITESTIEKFIIELLEKSGCQYVYALYTNTPERNRFEDGLVLERMRSAVGRITQNKAKTSDTKDEQGINSKQIRTIEKLRDMLLLKLISVQIRIKNLENFNGVIN